MATKRISDLQLRSNFDDSVSVPVDDSSQTWRATGAQIKAYIQAQIADLMKQTRDLYNLGLSCSVSSNALTIALKQLDGSTDPTAAAPVRIGFRSSTAGNGDSSLISAAAAASVVVSSGSTLGTSNGIASYLYVYALNNGGTIELAVSSKLFDEGTLQSTTAEGGAGAADAPDVLYSTTARTSKAIRLIGRLTVSEATAGTWTSAPTETSPAPWKSHSLYSQAGFFNEAENLGSLGSGTTTRSILDNPRSIIALTAARAYVLPTTGVPAGYEVEIIGTGDFALSIESSNADVICTLNVGTARLIALQATPTTKAHWAVKYIRSKTTVASTWTFNGSGSPGTSGSVNIVLERIMNFVNMYCPGPVATSGTSSTIFTANTALPSTFWPGQQASFSYNAARNNGGSDGSAGELLLTAAGVLSLHRTSGNTAWTNASSCGFQEDCAGTYYSALP